MGRYVKVIKRLRNSNITFFKKLFYLFFHQVCENNQVEPVEVGLNDQIIVIYGEYKNRKGTIVKIEESGVKDKDSASNSNRRAFVQFEDDLCVHLIPAHFLARIGGI